MFNLLVIDRLLSHETTSGTLSQFALSAIQSLGNPIDAIVLGDGIQSPGPISLVRTIHEKRPGTPIFFLEGELSKKIEAEAAYLGLQEQISRPPNIDRLKAEILSRTKVDTSAIASNPIEEPLPSEEEGDYVRVSARHFFWSRHSVLDLYLRLKNGRYLKILNQSEGFDESRLLTYMNRGATHFYIRTEDQARLIESCNAAAKRLGLDGDASLEVRAAPTLQLGELTLDYFKQSQTPAAALQAAFQFTQQLGSLVKRPEWRKDLTLRMFLEDLSSYRHGMAVALVSVLILKQMQLQSSRLNHALGLAALFHDIGLQGVFEENAEHSPETLTASEKKILESHPLLGAVALGRGPGVDPVSLKIIEQHHERRSNEGYPHGVGGSEIQPLAQIVGISDEIVAAIVMASQKPKFKVANHLEEKVFDGFSYPVINAVKALLRLSPQRVLVK